MEFVGLLGMILVILLVSLIAYLLVKIPTNVAERRGHANLDGVTALSYWGIFIAPLWLVALIWAYMGKEATPRERMSAALDDGYEPKSEPATATPAVATVAKPEALAVACDNCGRVIGKLETPQIWQEHIVCNECLKRLAAAQ